MAFTDRVRSNLAAADWRVFSFMVMNFCSSTGIVLANKFVMQNFGFKYATTLTMIHSIMTFLCLYITSLFGIFTPKKLPWLDTSKLAAGSMGFIVLTNLSLQYNSIGFYQMCKVMTTPVVVVIEALVYKKYLDNSLKIALIPVCVGVILTTSSDYQLNWVGTAYGVSAVVVTSFYQIWSGTLQKSLECDALQLQFYISAMSAVFIVPVVPIFDNYNMGSEKSIWMYEFTPERTLSILGTGCIAFLVNISIFLIIGKSSPLTYNIVGHCKTCFILLADFVLFDRPLDVQGGAGIAFALVGIFWYTHLKLEKNRLEQEARKAASANADEGEALQLIDDHSSEEKDGK